jgi:hypothetical protein
MDYRQRNCDTSSGARKRENGRVVIKSSFSCSKFVAKIAAGVGGLAEQGWRSHIAPVEPEGDRRRGMMGQGELSDEQRLAIQRQIERLREEHRDLDAAINALMLSGQADRLQVQRLKKRKLQLRDRLALLEDELTPDIIA